MLFIPAIIVEEKQRRDLVLYLLENYQYQNFETLGKSECSILDWIVSIALKNVLFFSKSSGQLLWIKLTCVQGITIEGNLVIDECIWFRANCFCHNKLLKINLTTRYFANLGFMNRIWKSFGGSKSSIYLMSVLNSLWQMWEMLCEILLLSVKYVNVCVCWVISNKFLTTPSLESANID